MKKNAKLLLFCAVLGLAILFSGCQTVRGVGQDLSILGRDIQNAAEGGGNAGQNH